MTTIERIRRRTRATAALLVLALLASCGGGGGYASNGGGVGTGGTGISMGTVTGFGSVVVDGTAYDSATPQYYAASAQSDETAVPSTAVELGDQLQVQLDAQGQPSTVVIEPALVGAVAALDTAGGTFQVNGVTVRLAGNGAPATYYAGVAGFGGLGNGMQVEVHGAWGVDTGGQGYVQATLIEQLPASNAVTRVTGVVTGLDATARTFRLGALSVDASAATVQPAAGALANGALVNVWSNQPVSGGVVHAGAVRVRTLAGGSGTARIGGLVAALSGTRFQVSGIPVDASATALAATVQGLSAGRYVVVQGSVDAATGTVVASALDAPGAAGSPVELRGTITGFVSAGNFLVRGVPVDASSAAFQGGSAAGLANGVYVDVVGTPGGAGNVITATRVTLASEAPDGATVTARGTIARVDPATSTFVLNWSHGGQTTSTTVTLAANVRYANGSAAQLLAGANVEVEATATAGGMTAYTVTFVAAAPGSSGSGSGSGGASGGGAQLETSGVVYGLTGSSFVVNGLLIQINGVNVTGGTLANGARVEVSFALQGGLNLAQQISVEH